MARKRRGSSSTPLDSPVFNKRRRTSKGELTYRSNASARSSHYGGRQTRSRAGVPGASPLVMLVDNSRPIARPRLQRQERQQSPQQKPDSGAQEEIPLQATAVTAAASDLFSVPEEEADESHPSLSAARERSKIEPSLSLKPQGEERNGDGDRITPQNTGAESTEIPLLKSAESAEDAALDRSPDSINQSTDPASPTSPRAPVASSPESKEADVSPVEGEVIASSQDGVCLLVIGSTLPAPQAQPAGEPEEAGIESPENAILDDLEETTLDDGSWGPAQGAIAGRGEPTRSREESVRILDLIRREEAFPLAVRTGELAESLVAHDLERARNSPAGRSPATSRMTQYAARGEGRLILPREGTRPPSSRAGFTDMTIRADPLVVAAAAAASHNAGINPAISTVSIPAPHFRPRSPTSRRESVGSSTESFGSSTGEWERQLLLGGLPAITRTSATPQLRSPTRYPRHPTFVDGSFVTPKGFVSSQSITRMSEKDKLTWPNNLWRLHKYRLSVRDHVLLNKPQAFTLPERGLSDKEAGSSLPSERHEEEKACSDDCYASDEGGGSEREESQESDDDDETDASEEDPEEIEVEEDITSEEAEKGDIMLSSQVASELDKEDLFIYGVITKEEEEKEDMEMDDQAFKVEGVEEVEEVKVEGEGEEEEGEEEEGELYNPETTPTGLVTPYSPVPMYDPRRRRVDDRPYSPSLPWTPYIDEYGRWVLAPTVVRPPPAGFFSDGDDDSRNDHFCMPEAAAKHIGLPEEELFDDDKEEAMAPSRYRDDSDDATWMETAEQLGLEFEAEMETERQEREDASQHDSWTNIHGAQMADLGEDGGGDDDVSCVSELQEEGSSNLSRKRARSPPDTGRRVLLSEEEMERVGNHPKRRRLSDRQGPAGEVRYSRSNNPSPSPSRAAAGSSDSATIPPPLETTVNSTPVEGEADRATILIPSIKENALRLTSSGGGGGFFGGGDEDDSGMMIAPPSDPQGPRTARSRPGPSGPFPLFAEDHQQQPWEGESGVRGWSSRSASFRSTASQSEASEANSSDSGADSSRHLEPLKDGPGVAVFATLVPQRVVKRARFIDDA